jgi:formamidopyrimidine-DNA glycosylase
MPELPEVQAHAERLTEAYAGVPLTRFVPLSFTALKTVQPAPSEAYGRPLDVVGRRGKYLLLDFGPVTFVVHLMQGGRLVVDAKQTAKPRGGLARFVFDSSPALLLTEQGTERKAGVWCVESGVALKSPPLASLGPEADPSGRTSWRPCSPSGRCACTGSSATSGRSPGSAAGWPTRCATGRSSRPSR